jgi:hypothetical protein
VEAYEPEGESSNSYHVKNEEAGQWQTTDWEVPLDSICKDIADIGWSRPKDS